MKTLYDVNGKIFDNVKDAKKYEEEVKAEELRMQKLEAERETRQKEIDDLRQKLCELEDAFYNDYYCDCDCDYNDNGDEYEKELKDKFGNTIKISARSNMPFDFEEFFNDLLSR